jgi:hypothetical protein
MNLHDIAVSHAERDWHVLPLRPGQKAPATKNGLLDATPDVARVSRFWRRHPTCNIGIRTGITFDALDLDGSEGADSFDEWCEQQKVPFDFTVVPAVATPSDGLHVYCTVTGAGNRARMLPGVDWRGRNGYVVAPGSVRADGKCWSWLDDWGSTNDPWQTPEQLHDLVTPPQVRPGGLTDAERLAYTSNTGGHGTPYGIAALDDEIRRVASAGQGSRNAQLNESAFVLYTLVAGGQLGETVVTAGLERAAVACGLGETETAQTLRSALRAGMEKPRRPPIR